MFATTQKINFYFSFTLILSSSNDLNMDQSNILLFVNPLPHNAAFLMHSRCIAVEPYVALIFHFKSTLKCCLQFVSIWTSLEFCRLVMGYRVTAQQCQDFGNTMTFF